MQAVKIYGEGGRAVFVINILTTLSGQLRAPAALTTGKYSSVSIAVESSLNGSIEALCKCSRRDKYVASASNRTTITWTLSSGW